MIHSLCHVEEDQVYCHPCQKLQLLVYSDEIGQLAYCLLQCRKLPLAIFNIFLVKSTHSIFVYDDTFNIIFYSPCYCLLPKMR